MIMLIDNLELAKRICADESDEKHIFIAAGYPNWKSLAEFFSNIGRTVVLHGDEAEKWLDANCIYYIHHEDKEGECLFESFIRLLKEVRDNLDSIYKSRIVDGRGETLVFGLTREGERAESFDDDSLIEIVRDADGVYHTFIHIGDDTPIGEATGVLGACIIELEKAIGKAPYEVQEDDFYDDINLSTGKTLKEVARKLRMRLAIMAGSMMHLE